MENNELLKEEVKNLKKYIKKFEESINNIEKLEIGINNLSDESNPNPVIHVSKGGEVLYSNESGTTILNAWDTNVGQLIGAKWYNFVRKAFIFGKCEAEVACKENLVYYLYFKAVGKNLLYIYGFNIAELRKAEEKIYNLNEQIRLLGNIDNVNKQLEIAKDAINSAKTASRIKSEFISNLSKDIKTPMNGIIGMIHLLTNTAMDREQIEYVETVQKYADYLLLIINDIFDLSRIETGEIDIEDIAFDLRLMMDDITEVLAKKGHKKNLQIVSLIEPDVPSLVSGDPGKLKQVIMNLGSNAIKFTEEGEVTIHIGLEEETDIDVKLRMSVIDTGIGMPSENLPYLFKSYYQLNPFSKKEESSSGLGLIISKHLVELMGGKLEVQTQEEKGSTFYFSIKLKKQKSDESILKEKEKEVDILKKVLIVGFDSNNRRVLTSYLKNWGCRYEESSNAETAIEKLEKAVDDKDPFKIALIDKEIPSIDGITLGKKIKATSKIKDTILVLLTSVGQKGDVTELQKIGFSAYFPKKIKQSILRDAIVKILAYEALDPITTRKGIITRHTMAEELKRQIRVLLVEDNVNEYSLILKLLENLGYGTDAVLNCEESVNFLEKTKYSLVLIDIRTPEMGGIDLIKFIRSNEKVHLNNNVYTIAIVDNITKESKEKYISEGINNFITAPVNPYNFREIIDKSLNDF
ncbi:MAG: response regulator [Desulfobacterales bacterium]|nr:response regulator [Desulfobacterales bacterium]